MFHQVLNYMYSALKFRKSILSIELGLSSEIIYSEMSPCEPDTDLH